MVPPQEESEDGDRVSFPRWGKRNVVSFHFTELVLEITVLEMLPRGTKVLFLNKVLVKFIGEIFSGGLPIPERPQQPF